MAGSVPVLLLLAVALPLVLADPFTFTDLYTPACTPISDPPPAPGFLLWSDPATWAPNPIPGIGAAVGANVTIPCNTAILLDSSPTLRSITLTVLQIQGFLKVEDPAVPVSYTVTACFVLVEGQLSIGSRSNHFKSKISFVLAPNPNNRQAWTASFNPPADPAHPRSMGHKPFAVMGGQVRLHGMPGGPDTPSWVRLNVSGKKGDLFLIVDTDVSASWPVGGQIAVASSDYQPDYSEQFGILGFDTDPRGTIVYIDSPLRNNHYGDPFGIPDGFGGYVDERAEVALLTRQIMITGVDEPPPWQYEGGHFMIFFTNIPQFIEGVEYWKMGQQGTLGRYNIHFHVCGDTNNQGLVRKNAIHDSKQRCIVIHASHNVTVDSNVAYNTSGHCFMVEEGGEQNNTFINNLGFRTRAVDRLIPLASDPTQSEETDNSPATFWITNMKNNYINNVGGGSDNSGYWTELRANVRGMSVYVPNLANLVPRNTPLGTYSGNVAHSNRGPGFRCYPHGIDPRLVYDSSSPIPSWQWSTTTGVITGMRIYKQAGDGFFMHNSNNIIVANSTFADNGYGVNIRGNTRGQVINSRFVGLSNNYGTPDPNACSQSWGANSCGPISGCTYPVTDPKNQRQRGWSHWRSPTFGVVVDQIGIWTDPAGAHTIANNRFFAYDTSCNRSAGGIAVGINGPAREWWNAAVNIRGIAPAPGVIPVWFPPDGFVFPDTSATPAQFFNGEVGSEYVFNDKDGSVVGGTGGALIANFPALMPPSSRYSCTMLPNSNALACPGACYRTLFFQYYEDAFSPWDNNSTRNHGDFSFLVVRRVEDNVTRVSEGNMWYSLGNMGTTGTNRYFFVNVLAPATYEISIGLANNNKSFWPTNMTMNLHDGGACGSPITLRILSTPSNQWTINFPDQNTIDNIFWKQCPGVTFTGNDSAWPVQYQYVCHRMRQVLQLDIAGYYANNIVLLNSGQHVQPCRLTYRCGVIGSRDWFYFNNSGLELHARVPLSSVGALGFQVPSFDHSSWAYSQAVLGYVGWNWNWFINTFTTPFNASLTPFPRMTFYTRKSFTVANTACYSGIWLEFLQNNGQVFYLNGIEIYRALMPAGNITAITWATDSKSLPSSTYNTTLINFGADTNATLVEGTNVIAVESHIAWTWQTSFLFDLKLSLQASNPACSGSLVMPEVCDGLDNNGDGLVDVDPVTKKPLTRPCSTFCGTGIETCTNGAYTACTAPPSLPETCNGVDDDCDGLVDNGPVGTQLDCAAGQVCFQGSCQQLGNNTVTQTVFTRSSSGWFYYEKAWLWTQYPNWATGRPASVILPMFKQGSAPFGTLSAGTCCTAYPQGPFATSLNDLTGGDSSFWFLKNFTLTADDAANTWGFSVSVRRNPGAAVFVGGQEIFRTGLPAGTILSTTYSNWLGDDQKVKWYSSTATRSTGVSAGTVAAGNNWMAVQLVQRQWVNELSLDVELTRYVNQSCTALPGSPATCVRVAPYSYTILPFGSTWSYLDASSALPPFSWIKPTFDNSAWPSGPAPLGNVNKGALRTNTSIVKDNRTTYYFRKTFNVPDGACYVNVTIDPSKVSDGMVLYINGVEAVRYQMPVYAPITGAKIDIFPTTIATTGKQLGPFTLSSNWFLAGSNTLAVEQHLSANTWYSTWDFDLAITGSRDVAKCLPFPI